MDGFRIGERGAVSGERPSATRRLMFQQIRGRLAMLPLSIRKQAIEVVKEKDRPCWFAPEWTQPSETYCQLKLILARLAVSPR